MSQFLSYAQKKFTCENPHLWNSRHRLSLSIRKCYCLRYLLVEKCTFPIVALPCKPNICMHGNKQAEDGSAAVCSFLLQCKVKAFCYLY